MITGVCSSIDHSNATVSVANHDRDTIMQDEEEVEWLKKLERIWDDLNKSLDLLQKILSHLDRGFVMNSDAGCLRSVIINEEIDSEK